VQTAVKGQDLPKDLRKSILDHFGYALRQNRQLTVANTPRLYNELPDDLSLQVCLHIPFCTPPLFFWVWWGGGRGPVGAFL
jgi:hypothetical protein